MDYFFPFHNDKNSDIYKAYQEKWVSALNELFEEQIKNDSKINRKLCLEKMRESLNKEERTMYDSITVSCRGFTGKLVKLKEVAFDAHVAYTLSIRELEKGVTHTMEHVKPNEIKLVSGRVTMG